MPPREDAIRFADRAEREDVKAAARSAAWTVCLLAEVLKAPEIDWAAASQLAGALEDQADDLKSVAWRLLLSDEPDLR